jgi:hypothetical protein
MALAASGAISFANLRDEFSPGSNTSISFSDYYLSGNKIFAKAGNNNATDLASGIPTSGALDLSDFYSKGRGFQFTISSAATNQNASTIFGDDYNVDYPKIIKVNSGVTVGATSTSAYAINVPSGASGSVTIQNAGNIYGKGGSAGNAGGDAIFAGTECTITNTGNIKSGGGGGGNGGVGGKGSADVTATMSSIADKTNDKPNWVTYSVLTSFAGGARPWNGLNGSQWGYYPTSASLRTNIANRGPVWLSFQVNTSGSYQLASYITDPYPEDGQTGQRGQPTVNISTAEDTASVGGGNFVNGLNWSGQYVNLTASTTYYITNYTSGTYSGSGFFYNDMGMYLYLATKTPTTGGTAGAGGAGASYNANAVSGGAGGGAGGTNAGAGGAGGNGGALGVAGANGVSGANGTGNNISFPSSAPTNGTAASSGGAAGNYINGLSNVTLNNSGTVAGNTA